MTDHNAIQLISDLFLRPGRMYAPDMGPLSKLSQKYPYFVPIHYIRAKEQFQNSDSPAEVRAKAFSYIGNPLFFNGFIKGENLRGGYIDEPSDAPYVPGYEAVSETRQEEVQPIEEEILLNEDHLVIDAVTPSETTGIEAETEPEPLPEPEETSVAETTMTGEEEDMSMHTTIEEVEPLFTPLFSEDYFRQQGVKVSNELPEDLSEEVIDPRDKSLMVMMSFADWLLHFKNTSVKHKEEQEDKKAVRTMWQKEKMAAAIQEENEEIPENVFEMAVNSITSEDGLASESLAEIYVKQQKYDKAIEMYRKLSLRNPEKNAYFAQKIRDILKEKEL